MIIGTDFLSFFATNSLVIAHTSDSLHSASTNPPKYNRVDSDYGRGELSRGELLAPGDDSKKKERGKSPFR